MDKLVGHVIFVLLMAAIIVAMDLLFFRHQFWHRLLANAGVVLVAVVLYLLFLR
jgi:hypothetical protein